MKITAWLTATVALSAFCAALGGLLLHGLYQDAPVHQAAWLGSDLISLVVAPTLWISYLYHVFAFNPLINLSFLYQNQE